MKNFGQATLEALLTFKVIFLLFGGVSYIIYLNYTKHISKFSMQKSLLCLESLNSSAYTCKKNLIRQLERLLFLQNNISVKLSSKKFINKVEVRSYLFKKKFNWSQELEKKR